MKKQIPTGLTVRHVVCPACGAAKGKMCRWNNGAAKFACHARYGALIDAEREFRAERGC